MKKKVEIIDFSTQEYYINEVKNSNYQYEVDNLSKKKYHISTFGCQMNENDSEKLAGILIQLGYIESKDQKKSDFILFNTCCVRENAEEKVYGHLGALKKLKENNPDLIIALCGCMMQQKEVVDIILKKYRHVNIIFGTYNINKLPEYIYRIDKENKRVVEIIDDDNIVVEGMPINREERYKAWITIIYGCNNYCSYCIVPYVRGRERSRELDSILREVKEVADKGYKEITLLGQNVNSYGKEFSGEVNFSTLLNEVSKISGIKRIRFMTSHPKDLSDELIDIISKKDNICNHIHLPMQSGSTKVLKEMNRGYTKEDYILLIDKIRNRIKDVSITTDIIIGFPGESEEDFQDTMDIVKYAEFDSAFTFIYSKRTGTPASKRVDQVEDEIKKRRFNELLKYQNEISNKVNKKMMGKIVEVLVEGRSKSNVDTFTGRTENNKIVNFHGNEKLIGKIVKIKINEIKTWSLTGDLYI